MNQNNESLDLAEKMVGHKWNWKEDSDEKIVQYDTNKP